MLTKFPEKDETRVCSTNHLIDLGQDGSQEPFNDTEAEKHVDLMQFFGVFLPIVIICGGARQRQHR